MSIDAIFLALDGVLFDTDELHLAACNAAFESAGFSLRWSMPQLRKAACEHGYARAIGALPVGQAVAPDAAMSELIAERDRHLRAAIDASAPAALPACMRLIEDALDAGCKIAILTDMPASIGAALLERQFGDDVNSKFAVVTGDVRYGLPMGTGPYAHALHAMGVLAASSVSVDSVPVGLRAAKAQGIWTVSTMPYQENDGRAAGADLWCPQLQELRALMPVQRDNEVRHPFVTFKTLGRWKAGARPAAGR